MTMTTKLDRGVTYYEEPSSIKSLDHVVSKGHVTNKICCICTTTRPMAIKLGKVVSYYKELPRIKSHNPLNTWSHEVI